MKEITICPVCGGKKFAFPEILWPELVAEWQISPQETDYINRQQGLSCVSCGNNLRSMALANAMLRSFNFDGLLKDFVRSEQAKSISVLEINEAGGLSSTLGGLQNYRFIKYPEYDMTKLNLESDTFDLVVHSDTLEHVPDIISGLSECRRVLKKGGRCIFTVPIIVNRLTRSRKGLKDSFHGRPTEKLQDFMVYFEFGADVWKFPLEAGFNNVLIHALEYPAGLAIEAIK